MLSIVTHADGRRASLERLLSVTARMRPRPFEVVVVDRGGPPVRPRPDLPVRVTTIDGPAGPARARRHGAGVACGSLLLFLDVDCVPDLTLVGEMRAALSRRDGLVMADVRDVPAAKDDWPPGPSRPAFPPQLGPVAPQPVPPERFRSAAFAARRGVLDHVARAVADRPDGHGDDLGQAAARAGVPIWLWPTALVHRHSTTRERART